MCLAGLGEPLVVPFASAWWGSVVAELLRHGIDEPSRACGRHLGKQSTLRIERNSLELVAISCRECRTMVLVKYFYRYIVPD